MGKLTIPMNMRTLLFEQGYPKLIVRLDILKFGVYDAVLCFNDGVGKRNVLNILGV
jgi:hypothetical protein